MADAAPPGEGGTKMSSRDGGSKGSPGAGGSKKPPREGGARKSRCGPAYVPCQDAEGRCQRLLRVYTRAARRWLAATLAVTNAPWVRRAGFVTAGALAVVLLVGGGL